MQPDFSQIGPILFAALAVFVIYRRFRRTFGRQPLRPGRMTFRIALFAVIACAMLPMAMRATPFLWAMLAGAILGVALALYGAAQTRFVMHGNQLHYVPHTYTGIAVSLLFVGRLVYRVVQTYLGVHATHVADLTQRFAPESMLRSPLTVGLLFVLIGYYMCYYSLVLYKSTHVKPEDIETIPAAAAL